MFAYGKNRFSHDVAQLKKNDFLQFSLKTYVVGTQVGDSNVYQKSINIF